MNDINFVAMRTGDLVAVYLSGGKAIGRVTKIVDYKVYVDWITGNCAWSWIPYPNAHFVDAVEALSVLNQGENDA